MEKVVHENENIKNWGSNTIPDIIDFIILRFYLFTFREKKREGEREGEKHRWLPLTYPQLGTWPTIQACALAGNWTSGLLTHRLVFNLLSHTSQGNIDCKTTKVIKQETKNDPAVPLLVIYLKKPKTPNWKDIYIHIFTSTLFTIAKIWKQPKCLSIDEWIKKWCIYTMEYDSAIKRMKSCYYNNMGGPRWYYAEWNKSDRGRQIPFNFIYMNLENK